MDLTDCLSDLHEMVLPADLFRDGALKKMGKIAHYFPQDPSQCFLVQPFRFRIDGNDSFEMEELILLVIEDFKIGMDHFPFERKSDDLTGQNDTRSLV